MSDQNPRERLIDALLAWATFNGEDVAPDYEAVLRTGCLGYENMSDEDLMADANSAIGDMEDDLSPGEELLEELAEIREAAELLRFSLGAHDIPKEEK